jgi:hypothetical protein
MSEYQKQDVDPHLASPIDPRPAPHGLSRRQFLVGATAAGLAALGPTDELWGADDPAARAPEAWRHAALTQLGNQWIVSCVGKGKTCAVLRLVPARRFTSFHDLELAKCTGEINVILDALIARNALPNRHPSFIVTPYAPFLAWMQMPSPDARLDRALTLESDPARFYQALGVSIAAYAPKPTRFWYWIGGGVACKKGGNTQITARLMNAERPSPIHDAELAEQTLRINAVLDRYQRANPRFVLSLFVTPKGLFLAWSTDDNRDGPLPRGAITALDSDDRVNEALGI